MAVCSISTSFATTSPRVAAGLPSAASRSIPTPSNGSRRGARTSRPGRRTCRRGAMRCRRQSAPRRARARTPARCLAEVGGIGDELKRLEAELDAVQSEVRDFLLGAAQPHPRSTPVGSGQRRQRRDCAAGARQGVRLPGPGPHRRRRAARPARLRDRRQAVRRPLFLPARRPRAPAPRARAVHARHPHPRARLRRVLHALHRQRRNAGRHRRNCPSSRPRCSR